MSKKFYYRAKFYPEGEHGPVQSKEDLLEEIRLYMDNYFYEEGKGGRTQLKISVIQFNGYPKDWTKEELEGSV